MLSLVVLSVLSFVAAQNIEPEVKITNGTDMSKTEVPFQVLIEGNISNCGGSLISEDEVLTAAHCMYKGKDCCSGLSNASDFKVISGTAYINKSKNDLIRHNISSFKVHDSYKHSCSHLHDIALLKLESKIKNVNVINLPTYSVSAEFMTTGWRVNKVDGKKPAIELQVSNVAIYGAKECKKYNQKYFKKGMLCAGSSADNILAYNNVSGGPLFCKVHNTLHGIASYPGETKKHIKVYTDVYYYLDWIKKNKKIFDLLGVNDHDGHDEL